jgi:hypothetical protein
MCQAQQGEEVRKIAHIVNPVLVAESSDLFVAQPLTFETMRAAQRVAASQVHVELFSAQYPEDHPVVPPDFRRTPDLERSILDYGTFRKQRKLPLLKDILDRLYQASDADYLAYTNVDIGLLPHFYLAVDQFVEAGCDALVINRRTISRSHTSIEQIPLMYAEIGKPHRGWDCFVFKRDAYPHYRLGTICVGAPRVGLALIANLVAYAQSFHEFKDEHLTFHLGDDRSWRASPYYDYAEHNTREVLRLIAELEEKVGPFDRSTPPGSFLFKQSRLGFVYELWVRYVNIPVAVRRLLTKATDR